MVIVRQKIKNFLKRSSVTPFLVSSIQHLRSPQMQSEIWRDYRKTRADAKFLRDEMARVPLVPGQKLLIGSVTDFIYQVKQEAMLAVALRMRGWQPVVLASRACPWAHRYFRAFGINDFVYLEDFALTPEEWQACNRDAADLLHRELKFSDIKSWRYRDAWIGPQILSSVVRTGHLAGPDLTDPSIRKQLSRVVPATLEAVCRVRHMVDSVRPKMILLNETNGPVIGPLSDLAVERGLNIIHFIQPSRDDAMILKRLTRETRRIHANSLALQSMERMRAMEWTPNRESVLERELKDRYGGKWFLQSRNQPDVKAKSKDELIRELDLDPGKKIAVVFSHILWDANIFYGEDLFEDYSDWFEQTVRAACQNPALNWVIKLHPANLWKRARDDAKGELAEVSLIRKKIGKLAPHVKLLFPETDIKSLSLFESIDYGITVRGTVGIELPCFGVPTLTAGTGRYSGLGFTVDSNSKEEYLERLANLHKMPALSPEKTLLAKKHAYGIFHLRPWEMKSFRSQFSYKKRGKHVLDHNLQFMAHSWNEVEQNGDLKAWADWAEKPELIDYLQDSHE